MKSIILLLSFYLSALGQKKENGIINFNGIYEAKCEFVDGEEDGKYFLRFYPNKKVISVYTDCEATVADLKGWFNMEMKFLSVGNYEIKDGKIEFFTTNVAGKIKYKGDIKEDGILNLEVVSLTKVQREYRFNKFDDIK